MEATVALGETIRDFVVSNYLAGDARSFGVETPLLELNVIDSASIFDLVDLLRKEAGVSVPVAEVLPQNFETISSMLRLVERLQRSRGELTESAQPAL